MKCNDKKARPMCRKDKGGPATQTEQALQANPEAPVDDGIDEADDCIILEDEDGCDVDARLEEVPLNDGGGGAGHV